jgi:hypothetical protein
VLVRGRFGGGAHEWLTGQCGEGAAGDPKAAATETDGGDGAGECHLVGGAALDAQDAGGFLNGEEGGEIFEAA